jgi:HEPN domain-containing protein
MIIYLLQKSVYLNMEKQEFDKDKLIKYWIDSSDDDFSTMLTLYETKRYNWALFLGHLIIEKLFKAYYVKINGDYPPYIHNLLRLAENSKLELLDEQKYILATITAFNINARYDDYKMSFQKKCTEEFATEWIEKIKSSRQWIKEILM